MKLSSAFIRLPYRFRADIAAAEVAALSEDAWQPHPRGWKGHRVLPLIAAEGENDPARFEGAMRPTAWLEELPAVKRLLLALDTVLGRTLLMQVEPDGEAETLVDAGYYWHRHARVFMPLQPASGTRWHCGPDEMEIPAGEVWMLDGWRGYRHEAPADEPLLCLIADTVGSASFWNTVKTSDRPLEPDREQAMSPRQVNLSGAGGRALETETVRFPRVMSPFELESLINAVMEDVRSAAPENAPHLPKLEAALEQFARQWQGIHAKHGESGEGDAAYKQALEQVVAQAATFAGAWTLPNGMDAAQLLYQTVVQNALKDDQGKPLAILPPGQAARQRKASQQVQAAPAPSPRAPDVTGPPPEDGGENQPRLHEQRGQHAEQGGNAPRSGDQGGQPSESAVQQITDPDQSPLRSVHTKSLPELLQQTGSSLLVTTYQAGKLVVCREDQGKLNTHFKLYNRPMGLAADSAGRLALGTNLTVEFYRNMRDVASKLEPKGRHDAAYLPRRAHVTGHIDIHEMDWADDELWLVNTRFSCLCTLDGEHSFVPRWRPPFISGYAAEDRCHLNGLEVVNGKPKYVTALGTSDVAGGWRENKAAGGILMDVESDEILCRGLSMPHSPRWYQDKLWVLESGNGSLATVDLESGRVETVIELPGFTRGLDFLGPFAFVGLSQVRESAVFSGISLTERVSERNCGVWVVNIHSGKLVGFLKFEDAVQEVFAVSVLPGTRFPDVVSGNDAHVGVSYALPEAALKEVVRPARTA